MFIDIACTQYAGYNIDTFVSFLDVRAEAYSVECIDVLHADTYLVGHKLRLITCIFKLIVFHFPNFNLK
jgi:hypothetical protein